MTSGRTVAAWVGYWVLEEHAIGALNLHDVESKMHEYADIEDRFSEIVEAAVTKQHGRSTSGPVGGRTARAARPAPPIEDTGA